MNAALQRQHVREAADALAELAPGNELVVTHGNGPQVGWLALQAESSASDEVRTLDVLGAETEGMIGYWIEQELGNRLPGRQVATLLTRVEVAPDDPAFQHPTKPIGPVYREEEGRRLARSHGWSLCSEPGGVRRVVASPEPREILERDVVEILLRAGVVVVCAGGGGIPVIRGADASLRGVEAVVDKDLSSALLADSLAADLLLLLTDVPAVFADWPKCRQPMGHVSPSQLRERDYSPGSMAPKVEAACRFVAPGRRRAAIGALEDATRLLAGEVGTQISLVEAHQVGNDLPEQTTEGPMSNLEKTRAALEEKLATLTVRVSKIQSHLREPGAKDWQERATEIENDPVLERLDETELGEIEEIRGALARIDAGTYGTCRSCGEPIGGPRLEALPYAALCIACAD